jgi:hypothetical protein
MGIVLVLGSSDPVFDAGVRLLRGRFRVNVCACAGITTLETDMLFKAWLDARTASDFDATSGDDDEVCSESDDVAGTCDRGCGFPLCGNLNLSNLSTSGSFMRLFGFDATGLRRSEYKDWSGS